MGLQHEHRRHRRVHTVTVGHRSEFDQPHPVTEPWRQHRRRLQREAGLADPTHPDQRHHPLFTDGVDDPVHGVVAADETRLLHRQVPGTTSTVRSDGNSVGILGADLEQLHRRRQIPQTPHPQIHHIHISGTDPAVEAASKIWPP